jgi:hypothetical protein
MKQCLPSILVRFFASTNKHHLKTTFKSELPERHIPRLVSLGILTCHFSRVYQVATSTGWQVAGTKLLSLNHITVEISTAFVTVVLLLVLFTVAGSIRYIWFYHRNKDTLEALFVPDGTIDWMLHAAKAAHTNLEVGVKDRVHFQKAIFGKRPSSTPICRLARVHSGVTLPDMKQSRCSVGRTGVKKGAVVTFNEIRDSSSSGPSSANSDEKGSRATVNLVQPQCDFYTSVELLQSDGRSSHGIVDPIILPKTEGKDESLDEKAA